MDKECRKKDLDSMCGELLKNAFLALLITEIPICRLEFGAHCMLYTCWTKKVWHLIKLSIYIIDHNTTHTFLL